MKRSIILLLLIGLVACNDDTKTSQSSSSQASSGTVFDRLDTSSTGVDFSNTIVENSELNYYKYGYLYNGGGVALGDVNNDGLADIYLSSTQGFDKLYLNKGNFKFEDISESSGIGNYSGYKTGINMIDVNQDGWTDIYVCRSGWSRNSKDLRNLLFINQKDGTFLESAKEYGLDDDNNSIQSVFFDYDRDGDLDVFIANHPPYFGSLMVDIINRIKNPSEPMSDKFYRNDNGKYTDVTKEAGLMNYGFGLGVVAADLNNDGWTDIYVTSDFEPRDLYYINQKDGTFKESLKDHFNHCSYFSMGIDVVDINNDKSLDLFVGEMLAEDNFRQKTNMAPMDMEKFAVMASNEMYFQYMRNSFSINNGLGDFYDIAHYAQVDQTDWSWSCVFGDYDLDGDEDLLVANGWLKDTQDKDTGKKANKLAKQNQKRITYDQLDQLLKSTPLENYAFENKGELKFLKVSSKWGFDHTGHSHGMAVGDLDNDGDLDVVTNNINEAASIYQNNTNGDNFIGFKLTGPNGNIEGLNAKLTLYSSNGVQYKEYVRVRGFQSCMQDFVHFGLAQNTTIDKLEVEWSDGNFQTVEGLTHGKYHNVSYIKSDNQKSDINAFAFEHKPYISFKHTESFFDDYKVQVLLPHLMSQLGPALSTADVNNDGLKDMFIGGAAGQSSQLLIQTKSGKFVNQTPNEFIEDKGYEDVEALFFDYNGDGLADLYVGSGSTEFIKNPNGNMDRLYQNLGNGKFKRANVLPLINSVCGTVSSSDFDGDGDLDLFVGSRIIPGQYPAPAPAYLLQNEGDRFIDVTKKLCPELVNSGLYNSSYWTDINNDGKIDLLLAGEWTNVKVLINKDDGFTLDNLNNQAALSGWWNHINVADLDGDGLQDIVLGNMGLNYKYEASGSEPFEVYSGDFNGDNKYDIVLGYYNDNSIYPVRGLQCSSEQIPDLKEKIHTYAEFGSANLFDIYGEVIKNALNYKADNFASGILWNQGNGQFNFEKLPYTTQFAPLQDTEITDINNDGKPDIIGVGNWFMSEIETPRADAGQGFILLNEGNRKWKSLPTNHSGFVANKDARQLESVSLPNGHLLLTVANNNNSVQCFELVNKAQLK